MDGTRRKFLKLGGLGVLGAAGMSSFKALAQQNPDAEVTQPGEMPALTAARWAMVVNLGALDTHHSWDKVFNACRIAHNIPTFDNPKDQIKWIWGEEFGKVFSDFEQPHLAERFHHLEVPVLCNHCEKPPCTKVCPTEATWRRESDGIVMMDWHRCIGCRYCVVACPYGSRSFNWKDPRSGLDEKFTSKYPTRMRGVVEKCTFCEDRLAHGQMPACVEACEHNELVFGDLEDASSEVRELLRDHLTLRRKPGLGTQPQVYYIV